MVLHSQLKKQIEDDRKDAGSNLRQDFNVINVQDMAAIQTGCIFEYDAAHPEGSGITEFVVAERFSDGVTVAQDGTVYFTDASTIWA
ncbi:unnamed protein product [Calypogeia fissa]